MEDQHIDQSAFVLLNVVLVLALAISLALAAPAEQFPLALSAICSFAGFINGMVAAFMREKVIVPRLTHWDSTAFFYAFGIVASGFMTVDASVIPQP